MRIFRMILLATTVWSAPGLGAMTPLAVVDTIFNRCDLNTLGLSYPAGLETFRVFSPGKADPHFHNGAVVVKFRNHLYCMWQVSETHEDSPDTHTVWSRSGDGGVTWSAPRTLAPSGAGAYNTSGGWHVNGDTLVAYINRWPADIDPKGGFTDYVTTTDGEHWSAAQPVMMADGTPMNGIFEQDPRAVAGGRIIGAAHFQPGLKVCPVYTDDSSGVRGWRRSVFRHSGSGRNSREMEPSLYQRSDSSLVMIFRDQKGTFHKLASESTDNGVTWTDAVGTNMPDARTKQCAGNFPNGTVYMVGTPAEGKIRIPLTITLSDDGRTFDRAWLLCAGGPDMPRKRRDGSAKRPGFHYAKALVADGYLYVVYALNKEDICITRVPVCEMTGDN